MKQLEQVYNYWFSRDYQIYFSKDSYKLDNEIKSKFLQTYLDGLKGKFNCNGPIQCLALVILYDQIPRHIFRNQKQAYATDNLALYYANIINDNKYYLKLNDIESCFAFMPFQHSNDINTVKKGINLYRKLDKYFNTDNTKHFLKFCIKHYLVLKKFGRYPKRNKILNRKSTIEEEKYINNSEYHF